MESVTNILQHPAVVVARRMLYAVTPNESSFPTLKDVPNYTDEAVPAFVILVFLEIPFLLLQGRRLTRINDGINSISAGLFSLLSGLLFRSVELASYIWVYERLNIITLPWDSPYTWVLGFLGVDFAYYWVHRTGHEVNFMWAFHQAHHSSEDYNLTTALRQSSFHRYTAWFFYIPMALFLPPSVFLVHFHFNLLYQFWLHTEIIRKLGPLELVLNTPSHHRVHHGRNRYCIDKNYGGTLIIWDRIFGTFAAEDEEVVYGLVHPINSWNPLYAQYGHIVYMWKMFWSLEGLDNKLSVIFKGPGWEPGKPRLGYLEDIPDIKAPQAKYDMTVPWWAAMYVIVNFLFTSLGYTLLAMKKRLVPTEVVVAAILYFILSLWSYGAIFDKRPHALILEIGRIMMFIFLEPFLSAALPMFARFYQLNHAVVIASAVMLAVFSLQLIMRKQKTL